MNDSEKLKLSAKAKTKYSMVSKVDTCTMFGKDY